MLSCVRARGIDDKNGLMRRLLIRHVYLRSVTRTHGMALAEPWMIYEEVCPKFPVENPNHECKLWQIGSPFVARSSRILKVGSPPGCQTCSRSQRRLCLLLLGLLDTWHKSGERPHVTGRTPCLSHKATTAAAGSRKPAHGEGVGG